MSTRFLPALAVALLWTLAPAAQAQFQPSGNTSGLGGVSGGSTGGGLGTTAGGTQAGSGTGGMFGNRSLGSSLSGGSRSMSGGRGVSGATRTADAAGTVTGSERFVRSNRQGQFVGSDTTDLRNIFSAMGSQQGGRGQQMGLNNRNQNQNPNEGMNDGAMGGNRRPVYRTQRVVEFDYRLPAPTVMGSAMGARISRAVRVPGAKVEVLMQERTAFLQGTVPTAHARDLAAQLALLEPGVSQVQNDLQVVPLIVVPTPPASPAVGPAVPPPAVPATPR
jgi:hypothetical protein